MLINGMKPHADEPQAIGRSPLFPEHNPQKTIP
jgi:hypothetical protein